MPDELLTRTAAFVFEEGLVRARFLDGAEVTLRDARENVDLCLNQVGQSQVAVCVDMRGLRSQSAEARAHFGAAPFGAAVALIVGSPLSRMLGNFFITVTRLRVPTRVFTSEGEAEQWVRTAAAAVRQLDGIA